MKYKIVSSKTAKNKPIKKIRSKLIKLTGFVNTQANKLASKLARRGINIEIEFLNDIIDKAIIMGDYSIFSEVNIDIANSDEDRMAKAHKIVKDITKIIQANDIKEIPNLSDDHLILFNLIKSASSI